MEVEQILPKVYTIKDVLDRSDCKQLVKLSESIGYTQTQLDVDGTFVENDIRNHSFAIYNSEDLASRIWNRISEHINPKQITDRETGTVLSVCGLKKTFRFYKFTEGQHFLMHFEGYDYGSMVFEEKEKDGSMSKLCLILYLNESHFNISSNQ
eukprot:TRINITY_DN5620_c0_g1_i1.p1 TRINITY_DN5620_c0_g1~~TRINITY_DN5620_c0_g1_i1.p1  ORF type:complete len:153 (+),score=24.18 TRINITY_DN5620_c0_g1_i1:47-505(+)